MDTKSENSTPEAEVPVLAPEVSSPPLSKHSEMVVLNKRKVCWAKRDAFFACLDKNGEILLNCGQHLVASVQFIL